MSKSCPAPNAPFATNAESMRAAYRMLTSEVWAARMELRDDDADETIANFIGRLRTSSPKLVLRKLARKERLTTDKLIAILAIMAAFSGLIGVADPRVIGLLAAGSDPARRARLRIAMFGVRMRKLYEEARWGWAPTPKLKAYFTSQPIGQGDLQCLRFWLRRLPTKKD